MVLTGYPSAILLLIITQVCVVNTTGFDSNSTIPRRKINATTLNSPLQTTNKMQTIVSGFYEAFTYREEIANLQSQKEIKDEGNPVSAVLLLIVGCISIVLLACLCTCYMHCRNAIIYGIFLLLSYHLREYFVENIFQLDFESIVQRTVNQKVDRCVEN